MSATQDLHDRVLAGQLVSGLGFQTTDTDLEALRDLVRDLPIPRDESGKQSRPLRIIEVGSWVGESAMAMIEACQNRVGTTVDGGPGQPEQCCNEPIAVEIYCVDAWSRAIATGLEPIIDSVQGSDGLYGLFLRNVQPYLAHPTQRIIPIRLPSFTASGLFKPGFADLVWIDGDHSPSAVAMDIEAWQPIVRPLGTLCGHDYDEVNQTVDAKLADREVLETGESIWYCQMGGQTRGAGEHAVTIDTVLAEMGPRPTRKRNVLLVQPLYDRGACDAGARDQYNAHRASRSGKYHVLMPGILQGSLLGFVCNHLWALGLYGYERGQVDDWAMQHADVEPPDGWLDLMMAERDRVGADILAAAIPLKDNSGDTSTALSNPRDPWTVTKLSMRQIAMLPETFSIDDLPLEGHPELAGTQLLINTGLMVVKLGDWALKIKGALNNQSHSGELATCFTVYDRIIRTQGPDGLGQYTCQTMSEDWNFARMANALGLKVFCTSKPFITHYGRQGFTNATHRNRFAPVGALSPEQRAAIEQANQELAAEAPHREVLAPA